MPYISWDKFEDGQQNQGSRKGKRREGKWLYLAANETYQIRPVDRPIRFFKAYYDHPDGSLRSAILDDPDNYPSVVSNPDVNVSPRYAIAVIDRDSGKVQILEGPGSIFEVFHNFYEMTEGDNPGGNEGGDFRIQVICPNNKKDRMTKYDTKFVGRAPFTDEEKQMLMEAKDDFNLAEIYAPNSVEEAEQRLFSDDWPPQKDDSQSSQQTSQAQPQQAAQAQPQKQPQAVEPQPQPQGQGAKSGDPWSW